VCRGAAVIEPAMLTITEIAGFAGAGLAGAAYVPQISHLIRARCSAGISRLAFEMWLLASLLVAARAIAIHAGVFIVLGGIQVTATTLIMFYAARYKDTRCPVHLSHQPRAEIVTRTAPAETNVLSGVRPAARLLNQPHLPGAVGHYARTSLACTSHSDVVPAQCGPEPDAQVVRSRPRLRTGPPRVSWRL
jgi:PQ loop repeat